MLSSSSRFARMRERGKMAMCAGGQQRHQARLIVAGDHHERSRRCQRIIDAGDSNVGGRAGCFQFFAVGEGGVNLRQSRDAAFPQKRRIGCNGALLGQEFRDGWYYAGGVRHAKDFSAQVFQFLDRRDLQRDCGPIVGSASWGPAEGPPRREGAGPRPSSKLAGYRPGSVRARSLRTPLRDAHH